MGGAIITLMVIQIPCLLFGFLTGHLILVYRRVKINPYMFMGFTLFLGVILHITIVYNFNSYFFESGLSKMEKNIILMLYLPLLSLVSVAGGYVLSKIKL